MAQSTFHHLAVKGISTVVPTQEIRLENDLQHYGGDPKKAARVAARIGIDRRRTAPCGVTAADLCQQAAENMFAGMGLASSGIDAVIFVSLSPDHCIPATACLLQHKLGLPKTCAAFDVHDQGCSGYVYGLWLAASLIESRACSRVLLLVGEAMARLVSRDNRIIGPLFGDCGTATLLEYREEPVPAWFELGTDGSGADALTVPAGRERLPLPDTAAKYAALCDPLCDAQGTPWRLIKICMDGGAVFDFAVSIVPEHLRSLLTYAEKQPGDIDRLVLHQANKQIMQVIAEKSGFSPDKAPMETFSAYGNQVGASIPSAICHMLGETLAEGSKTLLLSGYGVGLSWASAILTMNVPWLSGVRDYVMPPDHQTPEQFYGHWVEKITGQKI